MEIRINLATASLKDAEHAIFLIGAYFGMTNLPTVARNTEVQPPAAVMSHPSNVTPQEVGYVHSHNVDPSGWLGTPPAVQPLAASAPAVPLSPAAVFAQPPAALPSGAGETPMTADPAEVFAGNPAAPVVSAPMVATPAAAVVAPAGAACSPAVAPSAPIAAAPVGTSPAQAPAPAASVELDATGLPWDARIHSLGEGGTHPKTDKGVWRKKRGVQPLEVSQVEAELRALMGTTPPAPPVAPQPPAPPVAPQPPAADLPAPQTFEQFMPRVTSAVMEGVLPQPAIMEAVTAYGLASITALAQATDKVPAVWAYLKSKYPTLK